MSFHETEIDDKNENHFRKSDKMKDIIIVKEVYGYKGIKFEIELEYYYDEKFDDYYVRE